MNNEDINFTGKEKELLNRMIKLYWEEYNNEHEDNIEDWRTTFYLVKKLNTVFL